MTATSFNRLGQEKSAYLLQHKNNPVHWWPYGPEALAAAKAQNKPIFLSIGYAACHWCHVMAHECFENAEAAKLLNENFISIKVDREEFPDLDAYYQLACQLFTRSGGWPLSAFLLPDMRPFFVGTYFPLSTSSDKRPSFLQLLNEFKQVYKQDFAKLETQAKSVTEAIERGVYPKEPVEFHGHYPPPHGVLKAVEQFADQESGGYGAAPKFPHFAFYEWALEQMVEGMVEKPQGEHIIKTLEHMLMGGIMDQARGGIHRYATDKSWIVPHFEKMLYDQSGLLRTLAKLSVLYPSPLVFDAMANTLGYLEAEMFSEQGYFFSSQDADSEGVEGLYFTYSEQEFDDMLNDQFDQDNEKHHQILDQREQIKRWLGITSAGNFEQGLNVLHLRPEHKSEIFTQAGWDTIRAIRQAVIQDRKQRLPPATDTKGVASWNFMLISALCDVVQYCRIVPIKEKAMALINLAWPKIEQRFLKPVINEAGLPTILHTTTQERSLPYLEDYVGHAESLLRLYEITADSNYKRKLQALLPDITNAFVSEGNILTRAKQGLEASHPNLSLPAFDGAFKSPAATLIQVLRRASILDFNASLLHAIDEVPTKPITEQNKHNFSARQALVHESLKNPLQAGEALRALSYPEQAYRAIKVPAAWAQNKDFWGIMGNFMPRFVFDYHQESNDNWQVCRAEACDLQGSGMQQFVEALSAKKNNPTSA